MGSASFSILTGLRESIALVFGIAVFRKGQGKTASALAVEVLP